MPFIVKATRPGAEPIPREFWREIPCGHPPDPVAAYSPDGSAVCHCGSLLFFQDALPERPEEAPGPIVPCSKCGCYVAVPECPTTVVSRLAVATLEEAREAAQAPMLERAMGYAPDSWKTNWQVAKELPESGGTVGPLPDGTVIEVEALGAIDLFNRAGLSKGPPYLTVAEVIAAFNAKFAPSPSVPERVTVRSLAVGSRFAWRGEVWRLDQNEPSYVEARAEQFSNRATFYDPATARKSGDLCWDVTVEPFPSPSVAEEV